MMFNDHFGLTDAVLTERKRVTRRIIKCNYLIGKVTSIIFSEGRFIGVIGNEEDYILINPPYQVGEVVAVAQRYSEILKKSPYWDYITAGIYEDNKGWNNKMFVRADLMDHRIKITDIRCERLQDISDEDCLKEGIEDYPFGWVYWDINIKSSGGMQSYSTPREAFAVLIDKISGRGTWKSNPFVWRVEYKLIK